ncbi:MAG: hypothetical protein AAFZ87_03105 [Planctomycetota bacterium]
MTLRLPGLAALAAAGLLLGASAPASTPRAHASPLAERPPDGADDERADAWPDPADKGALADALNNLRKSKSDEQIAQWSGALVEIGPAAAPRLLSAMAREKSEVSRDRMAAVLDQVTAAEHTRLLAKEFGSKSIDVRLFVLRRVAELGDPGLREQAEKIWTRAEADKVERDAKAKSKNKRKRKEPDPQEVLEHQRAAVLVLACGSPASLDHLVELAGSKDWNAWQSALVAAATHGAGANAELAPALAERLDPKKPRPVRAGALRLLAHAGTEAETSAIARMLDARENNVKIAAINALRRIVDGAEPLEKVSTFDAIEKAKAWKQRVR